MQDLNEVIAAAENAITGAPDLDALEGLRVMYLGKQGVMTQHLKGLGRLPPEERPLAGQAINRAKQALQAAIEARRGDLESARLNARLEAERVDVTLPGRGQAPGGLHPVTRTLERIEAFFAQVGFEIAEGPEALVEVRLNAGGEPLIARITRGAARALDLKVGQPVVALIKTTAFDRPDDFS